MIAKVKFVAISIMFLFYVYMYAWPADHIHVASLYMQLFIQMK